MNSIPINHALIFAAALFMIGVIGLVIRRNLVFVLMSIEIMLNASVIAFAAASARWHQADGQSVILFILVIVACETAVGLALLLRIYHNWRTMDSDEVSEMRG